MRQITLGLTQYTQDYDEIVVPNNNGSGSELKCYFDILQPYLKSRQIGLCPDEEDEKTQCTPFGRTDKPLSYGINQLYYNDPDRNIFDGLTAKPLAAIEDSSRTIFIGDVVKQTADTDYCHQVTGQVYSAGPPPTLGRADQGAYVARHFDGTNWAYMDGHVKWLRFDKAFELNTAGTHYRFFTPQDD